MTMLREINRVVNGRLDSSDHFIGKPASEIPSGFSNAAFLLNDIDTAFPDRLYRLEILTPPEAGSLVLDKRGVGMFSGAPEGTYAGTQRVEKFDPGVGRVSSVTGTYTIQVGALPSTVLGVTVSPATATGSQQFTASVQGENNPSQDVTWSSTGGTISASGAFTAPVRTLTVQTITVRATSVQDPSMWDEAAITIAALPPVPTVNGVSVSPGTAIVGEDGTVQFTATVIGNNSPAQGVTWATTLGTVSAEGLLMAPARTLAPRLGTMTATSTLDPSKSGTATFTIPALIAVPITRTVSVLLGEAHGAAANLAGLMVSFHVAAGPHNAQSALFQSATETTDETGRLTFSFASAVVAPGTEGLLSVLMPDGRHYLGLAVVA